MTNQCRHGNQGVACWHPQCRVAAGEAYERAQSQDGFRRARQSMLGSVAARRFPPGSAGDRQPDFGMRQRGPYVPGVSVGSCRLCGDPIPPSELDESRIGGRAHRYCVVKSKSDAAIRAQGRSPAPTRRFA